MLTGKREKDTNNPAFLPHRVPLVVEETQYIPPSLTSQHSTSKTEDIPNKSLSLQGDGASYETKSPPTSSKPTTNQTFAPQTKNPPILLSTHPPIYSSKKKTPNIQNQNPPPIHPNPKLRTQHHKKKKNKKTSPHTKYHTARTVEPENLQR